MVSVIVTCYNIEKYIAKCLDSLKKQTLKDFEVLIINDGSTDESEKVIKNTIKNDKRFYYYKKKNGGVSSARNYGLKMAKGEYICFVDGDDYVERNYLEVLYNSLTNGNNDFSICNIKRVYKDHSSLNKIDEQIVRECRYPALWNKMCKRDIFMKYNIKFLENVWYEDLAVGTELYLVSNKFAVTDSYIYNYIQHDSSLIRTYDDRIFDIYKITEEIERFYKDNNISKDKYVSIEFINIYHILVGTIYRASFHECFSVKMIKDIYKYVKEKYPHWHKNSYIKNLSLSFRFFLLALYLHQNILIYVLLKLFNKKFQL